MTMVEAEIRAALRAGAGDVEPWIARQAWEATPTGWTVATPLKSRIFRLMPVPGGVCVAAFMDRSEPPAVWFVPGRRG